jgi:RNA polymerase sigma factor (sigma-70 family)
MTHDVKQLQKTIMKRMARWRDNPEWEDGVQEAFIRLWKDMEAGEITDYSYLVRRAAQWGRAYLYSSHHPPTGALPRERHGFSRATGDATREKMRAYMKDYELLHGNPPSLNQMSRDLGIHLSTIAAQHKKIKTQSFEYVKTEDGRLDRRHYEATQMSLSVDIFNSYGEFDESFSSFTATPGFEDDFIAQDNFNYLIRNLDDELKQIMVLIHVYGINQKRIGEMLGLDPFPQAKVMKRVTKAYKLLRKELEDASS